MSNNYKNFKIVGKPDKGASSKGLKLRWLNYANNLDKIPPDYLWQVTGIEELKSTAYEKKLEEMVRAQLKEEFPNVEKMKSYELLVDAVMLNLKKKG